MVGVNDTQRFLGSQYELTEKIGSGAMGQVWRARVRSDAVQPGAGGPSDLAVKLLRSDLAGDPDIVRRFIQERSILMGLRHRNIVQVTDMVAEGDRLGIVMEYLPGGTLADALKTKGTLPASLVVPLVCTVLDALAYAHGRGLLHRDVKPANVLLGSVGITEPDTAKLSDFGIASFTDEQGAHATGLVGSPAYMPPEIFTTGIVSAESDIYSTGIMLYELLSGRTPFAGTGTAHTVGVRHVTVDPPALPVDQQLWVIIDQMLAKHPEDRLSAAEAANALRSLPASALSADALAPLAEPDWDAAHTQLGASANLAKAAHPEPPEQPSAGSIDVEATMLGGKPTPKIEFIHAPSQRPKPKPWVIACIIVLAVALVAGGITLAMVKGAFNRSSAGESSAPTSWVPAHITGEASPTGLRIDYDAAPSDSPAGSVLLTVTATAPRSTGLSGDLLVVIPPATGNDCPSLGDANLQPATASTDSVSQSCAYKLPVTLSTGAATTVSLQVAGDLGDDLSAWLGLIADQTRQALQSVTGQGFALQRVSGIEVEADSLIRTTSEPQVHYRVFAIWQGGQQELFRQDTLAFQATDLLRSLTGGAGLDGVTVTSCPEAQVRGISVFAQQSTQTCFVQVTIGDLTSRQAMFTISNSGR